MKIDNTGIITPSGYAVDMQGAPYSPGNDFSRILDQAMQSSQIPDHPLKALTMMEPVTAIPQGMAEIDENEVIERVEGLLDSLDMYRTHLQNHLISSGDIQPLLADMSRKANYLSVMVDGVQNENLKSIVNQTLITTSLEEVKFYRGDYSS